MSAAGDGGDTGAFAALHPSLQYHLVNTYRWASLRPVQEVTIGPVLAGEHVLVTAPTAGGKTEAAALPLFSRLLTEAWSPLAILYVSPLRALLNDLETRLARLASCVGRRVALWHGDVGPAARHRIADNPPDLLLTTPESIEVILGSRQHDREAILGHLQAVVVDELHAFAGDDRGWHLLAVLERAQRLAGRPLQRVGLSATLGNPQELLGWLTGGDRVPGRSRVVQPPEIEAAPAEVRIDYSGSLANAAEIVARLDPAGKRLVFCDSRSRVEELAYGLRERAVETYVSHGSLGADERRQAERAFSEARGCVIVATSTLELGIDVGDLDRVIQIDAPARVASFLQRLGRTGRRPGTPRNLLFVATREPALVQACALVHLWRQGFVEPVVPAPMPVAILAQQLLMLALQPGGAAPGGWRDWIPSTVALAGVAGATMAEIEAFLVEAGILFESSGYLGIGPAGEPRVRGKAFLELLTSFATAPLFRVLHGTSEIGQVDEATFQLQAEGVPVILLGGRAWRVNHLDWHDRRAYVEPADVQGRSLWPGDSVALSATLCRAMRTCLATPPDLPLTRRATAALETFRTTLPWVEADHTTLVREAQKARWWTFAGLRANAALADALAAHGVAVQSRDNLSIGLAAPFSEERFRAAVVDAAAQATPPAPTSLAVEALTGMKFSWCLPPAMALAALRQRLADPIAVRGVLGEPVTVGLTAGAG